MTKQYRGDPHPAHGPGDPLMTTPTTSLPDPFAPAGTWVIDPPRSTVRFAIRHLMVATVHGHFDGLTGSLRVDDDGAARAAGAVHAATLHTGNAIRDGRLHGPEVFDTDRYPDIRLCSTAIEEADAGTWTITGELTIKRTTRPIQLRARRVAAADNMLELKLNGQLTRSEFGISSEELLNAGISDTVKLELHVTLAPAPKRLRGMSTPQLDPARRDARTA